ncbi:MAG: sigma 54-interacting transcriptional regulator [Fimbriimonadaceae bacterium]|nr:sigma 54-interacting transcriptional regulator [Fimbriimonadaceae bacterium]
MSSLNRLLFSWIGDADLLAWAAAHGDREKEEVRRVTGKSARPESELGPVRTLTTQQRFDAVHLLTDKEPSIGKRFAAWVGPHATVHSVRLASPVDYHTIFEASDGVLGRVVAGAETPLSIAIHLSSGTPAMTAIWVLLGKSRYPAEFFQTHRGSVVATEIPFDLRVDFLPQVLQASDRVLQEGVLATDGSRAFEEVTGRSQQIKAAILRAHRIAMRDVSVLLLGESGVGKDVFARAIHAASPRRDGPMVAINCAAIPKELLESELFGHTKGAFTGAERERQGAFEQADRGSLFLDEVGECDLMMQAKLLRVLQPAAADSGTTRTYRRVGDTSDRRANVRVIAATNCDLQAEVAAGRFREDLYYRLAPLTLRIPALRDRPSDIPVIAEQLLERINAEFATAEPGYSPKSLAVRTLRFIAEQPWPGNVRQLQNALLQAAVLVEGEQIRPEHVRDALADSTRLTQVPAEPLLGQGFSLARHLEDIQKRFLARAMSQAGGKKMVAAELLGYSNYQTLAAQLERLNVVWE